MKEYEEIGYEVDPEAWIDIEDEKSIACQYAVKKVQRDFEQEWQGIEYKLNTVGSSRGDYPFVTMTIGLATDKFGKIAAITLLNVHKEGEGKKALSVQFYSQRLYFYMIKICMETAVRNIQVQMFFMQELTVAARPCILIGCL